MILIRVSGGGFVDKAHFKGGEALSRFSLFFRELPADIVGYAHRGYSPRLGNSDDAVFVVPRFVEDDGQLGGLAAAGGALDDDYLVIRQVIEDLRALIVYRELSGIHMRS
jgi:hypothetical protein